MSDRAPASFTLYHVKGHEKYIADLLSSYGFMVGKDFNNPSPKAVVEGITLQSEESSLDILEEIGYELEQHGIAYRGAQDAKYEYEARVRVYTPALGSAVFSGTQQGGLVVSGDAVANVADRLTDLVEEVKNTGTPLDLDAVESCAQALAELAGYAWLNEFARLDSLIETAQ